MAKVSTQPVAVKRTRAGARQYVCSGHGLVHDSSFLCPDHEPGPAVTDDE